MRNPRAIQILNWKKRRNENQIAIQQLYLIEDLLKTWKLRGDNTKYLSEFIPIRLVTILEVFTRDTIREIVDHGSEYSDRAGKITTTKIDFDFVKHMVGKRLTIGDLVAHSVSISSIDNIIAALEILIPNFTTKMKTSHARWTEEQSTWPLSPIIKDFDQTICQLKRLFYIRHIVTHELPTNTVFDISEVEQFCSASLNFIQACDWVVIECLHGSVAQTQLQMNIDAAEELKKLEKKMAAALSQVKKLRSIDVPKLERVQKNWTVFANDTASLHASIVEHGSMYSLIWNDSMIDLTAKREKELKELVAEWME